MQNIVLSLTASDLNIANDFCFLCALDHIIFGRYAAGQLEKEDKQTTVHFILSLIYQNSNC